MITLPEIEQEVLQSYLDEQLRLLDSSDPLYKIRLKAVRRFEELGFPTRKTEVYRYIKLRQLYAQKYELAAQSSSAQSIDSYIHPECRQSCLVLVNGRYQPSLSSTKGLPSKVVVTSLQEAARTYGTLLNNQMTQSLKDETDPFAVLNAALHQEGLFLYIPPNTAIETPVQVLHLVDAKDQKLVLMPRITAFVGGQSQLNLIATKHCVNGNTHFVNQVAEFIVEENAHATYTQDLSDEGVDSWHFDAVRMSLKKNATFKTFCVTQGSETVRTDYRGTLNGENGEISLHGVWKLRDQREAHTNVYIDHQAPYCRSNQLFKGVLTDFSRSSFEGKIMVRQAAQKTEAFQLNSNLILDDRAHADSKPNLEIFADDVKASHGATVGQLDPEQVFYMKTRGFPEAAAKQLLVYGYCEEVIDLIPLDSLKSTLSVKFRK